VRYSTFTPEVITLTLAGRAGGPPIEGPISATVLVDAVEY
jgi:hypothetical protein